jgi:hypothetical protein
LLVVSGALTAAGARTTAQNERAAHSAARQMLAQLRLPAGAKRVSSDLSRASLLGHAPEHPATRSLVDVHSFWHVPGNPAAVLAWIEAHPPAGSMRQASGGLETASAERATWDGYNFGAVNGAIESRWLLVEVARAAGGGTALRADAQAVWVVAKPRTERIPLPVKAISITSSRPGKPASPAHTVTGPDRIRRIVAFVDGLPRAQPGVLACPADVGPLVRLEFRPALQAAPTATAIADGSGCGLVTLRIRGHREPALTGGPRLIRWLQSQLGITFAGRRLSISSVR